MLEEVMRGPCGLVFADPEGRHYRVHLEDGIERRLAEQLVQGFPGPGALTAMQVVGVRLVREGLERVAADGAADPSQLRLVRLTPGMLAEIGPVEDVIEDLIDEAIGNFCEREGLVLDEILELWDGCTRTLGQRVAPQAEGAPVTRFLPREQFKVALLKKRPAPKKVLDTIFLRIFVRWKPRPAYLWQGFLMRLVDFLEGPSIRVLRSIRACPSGGTGPLEYIALGHDILAVGLARANARADLRAQQKQRIDRIFDRSLWLGFMLFLQ